MKRKRARKMLETALEWVGDDDETSFEPYSFGALTLPQFLAEYCWVVFAAGFRYSTVRVKSEELTRAFVEFDPCRLMSLRIDVDALPIRRADKANGFLAGARNVIGYGFDEYRDHLRRRVEMDGDARVLAELPWIGPVTKNHLAKNIGLMDVAKDDRWLVRCAEECNSEPEELVSYLAEQSDYQRHQVDTILWRYCAKYQEVP